MKKLSDNWSTEEMLDLLKVKESEGIVITEEESKELDRLEKERQVLSDKIERGGE